MVNVYNVLKVLSGMVRIVLKRFDHDD
jgi:hypothetical protein